MADMRTPVHEQIRAALASGDPPKVADLKQLRSRHQRQIRNAKISFWVAIVILNLLIWVPLPVDIPFAGKVGIAAICLVYAFSAPIVMIRRHQRSLSALELVSPGPKRRQASEAGQRYIDRVREEGRSFIRAEQELIAGSKYATD